MVNKNKFYGYGVNGYIKYQPPGEYNKVLEDGTIVLVSNYKIYDNILEFKSQRVFDNLVDIKEDLLFINGNPNFGVPKTLWSYENNYSYIKTYRTRIIYKKKINKYKTLYKDNKGYIYIINTLKKYKKECIKDSLEILNRYRRQMTYSIYTRHLKNDNKFYCDLVYN